MRRGNVRLAVDAMRRTEDRKRPDWFHVALAAVTLAVVVLMVYQWAQCDGAFVRTLFWFHCMPG